MMVVSFLTLHGVMTFHNVLFEHTFKYKGVFIQTLIARPAESEQPGAEINFYSFKFM
ncbi:hypothetical protein [Cytobacillus gottheilii]|uniref:hypothetical protein n=1 Tax=Cytobacillus gottheilii TaxID=859144 RepID=UPI001C5A270E|nr:hypothetical protein [Cytobacillus gottheilii]